MLSRKFFQENNGVLRSGLSDRCWHYRIGLVTDPDIQTVILNKVRNRVSKSKSTLDDLIVHDVERFALPVGSFLFVYWGITSLELSDKVYDVVNIATSIVIAIFLIRFFSSTLHVILTSHIRNQFR